MNTLKTFLAALFILALTMTQVYFCTYTEVSKVLLWFTPLAIAIIAGLIAGIKGGKEVRNSVIFFMFLILYIFTYIALNER
jgi:uncharacterized membrane protein YfcA